jgi:hypothetical protein
MSRFHSYKIQGKNILSAKMVRVVDIFLSCQEPSHTAGQSETSRRQVYSEVMESTDTKSYTRGHITHFPFLSSIFTRFRRIDLHTYLQYRICAPCKLGLLRSHYRKIFHTRQALASSSNATWYYHHAQHLRFFFFANEHLRNLNKATRGKPKHTTATRSANLTHTLPLAVSRAAVTSLWRLAGEHTSPVALDRAVVARARGGLLHWSSSRRLPQPAESSFPPSNCPQTQQLSWFVAVYLWQVRPRRTGRRPIATWRL